VKEEYPSKATDLFMLLRTLKIPIRGRLLFAIGERGTVQFISWFIDEMQNGKLSHSSAYRILMGMVYSGRRDEIAYLLKKYIHLFKPVLHKPWNQHADGAMGNSIFSALTNVNGGYHPDIRDILKEAFKGENIPELFPKNTFLELLTYRKVKCALVILDVLSINPFVDIPSKYFELEGRGSNNFVGYEKELTNVLCQYIVNNCDESEASMLCFHKNTIIKQAASNALLLISKGENNGDV